MADQQQPSQEEQEQVAAKLNEIGDRVQHDQAFAEQLRNDAEGTLKAEGLPADAIEGLLVAVGMREQAEVSGYNWNWWGSWFSQPTRLVGNDGASIIGQNGLNLISNSSNFRPY